MPSWPVCEPQLATSCHARASQCGSVHGTRVTPSSSCDSDLTFTTRPHGAAYVLVLGFNRSFVRPSFARDPHASYVDSARLALRSVLSLHRVNSSLPIRLLVSGERDSRIEAVFSSLGVHVAPSPLASAAALAPAWASPWMRGTFAKLAALTITSYRRIVLLDSDTIVVRNVDHLSGAPAPLAGYFHFHNGFTCPQHAPSAHASGDECARGVLNSGVLTLQPSLERFATAQRMLADESALADEGPWEGSDQRLWHALYADGVHELPFGYNANADANLTASEWARVHILHDIVVQRKRGWARSGHLPLVAELTRQAQSLLRSSTGK